MIVKCISDTHNDHNDLDSKDLECDILIHAGDANTKGNYTEGLNFLYWFVKQPAKYKIVVPGNHDAKLRDHPDLIKLAKDIGIHVLNDDALEINGIRFYGVSKCFSDEDRDEIFNVTRRDRLNAWKNIPEDLDFLITHIPPKYILDQNQEGRSIGCSQLTEKVKIAKPKYHIFGHVHEKGGQHQNSWETRFINVAVKNRLYFTARGPTIIGVKDDQHTN